MRRKITIIITLAVLAFLAVRFIGAIRAQENMGKEIYRINYYTQERR